jgi:hypothetical protein
MGLPPRKKKVRRGKQKETTDVLEPLRRKMQVRGWLVIKLHGNQFQAGLPDLICFHVKFGYRFIELKTKTGSLSASQIKSFYNLSKHGARIYLLRGPEDYNLLFGPPNWEHIKNYDITRMPKGFEHGQRPEERT